MGSSQVTGSRLGSAWGSTLFLAVFAGNDRRPQAQALVCLAEAVRLDAGRSHDLAGAGAAEDGRDAELLAQLVEVVQHWDELVWVHPLNTVHKQLGPALLQQARGSGWTLNTICSTSA